LDIQEAFEYLKRSGTHETEPSEDDPEFGLFNKRYETWTLKKNEHTLCAVSFAWTQRDPISKKMYRITRQGLNILNKRGTSFLAHRKFVENETWPQWFEMAGSFEDVRHLFES